MLKRNSFFLGIFLLSTIVLLLTSCKEKVIEESIFDPQNKESEQAVAVYEKIAAKVNRVFILDNSGVELYFQEKDNDKLLKTPSFIDMPLEKLQTTYNLIRYENGNLMYVVEFPFSESNDWAITYESFFDKNGNLVAFVRKCSFLNSGCAEIAREKSEYFYTSSHQLIKKTYVLVDDNEKTLKATECTFNYRFPYSIETTVDHWLAKHHLNN